MNITRIETDGGTIAVVSGSEVLIRMSSRPWISWPPCNMKRTAAAL